MLHPRFVIPALALILVAFELNVTAQLGGGSYGNVKVRALYADGRPADRQLRVQLMEGSSTAPIREAFTDSGGMAEFSRLAIGIYHVVVTGADIEPADSGQFEVDGRKATQSQFITVHRISESKGKQPTSGPPLVAATDLGVPDAAQKQFDKANEAMTQQDWKKALTLLNRAISIYPQYASAYNNLGVVYTKMNDTAHAREALEKAISLNDHFASALQNLAKVYLQIQNPVQAEALLDKAVAMDPTNAMGLMLLAQAELLNSQYDPAIINAQKVHALAKEHMAVVHYIAARALEHRNRLQEAVNELQTLLREEPQGPRADQARDEIKRIERYVHSLAASAPVR